MHDYKKIRTGETGVNKNGIPMVIKEYTNKRNVIVEFPSTGEIVRCEYSQFAKGSIKSHFSPSVYGVGIVGLETTKINGKIVKSYKTWSSLLERCYANKPNRNKTYVNCTVADEWVYYSNFKKWFDENYYEIDNEKMELDKDILVKGNKIYSPEACVFVPHSINTLFIKSNTTRGKYPIGVNYKKSINKYQARYSDINKKSVYLGCFETVIDAFYAYKIAKENYIKEVADKYKNYIPNKLYEAMYNYQIDIND